MSEEERKSEPATPRQIKKLYAVLRNCGFNPTEQVKKLRAEKGPFTKAGISKLIDQFEMDRKKEVVDAPEEDGDIKEKKEVVSDLDVDKDRLNKVYKEEERATPAQIKRLYAVLYNLDIEPKDYIQEKGITGFNHLGKREISRIIAELEESGAHFLHNEQQPQQQQQKKVEPQQQPQKKVDEVEEVADVADKADVKESLDLIEEKGKVLRKCLEVASRIAIETHTLNAYSDEYQKTSVILKLARILFEHRNK